MFDILKVVGFQWDAGNQRKNEDEHGVSQTEAEEAFLNLPLIVLDDLLHRQVESRFVALGQTTVGRHLCIVFTLRESDTKIRVISARDQSKKERHLYGKTR